MAGIEMKSVRWAFRFGEWVPSRHQWLQAAECVQSEEKERIGRFVFKRDSKSAMSGRLLIRKAVNECLGIPYGDISLERTEKGKPFLKNEHPKCPGFNFNVSHQGQFAVLAAEPSNQVGVDIMQVERPRGNRSVSDFFNTMRRQFTEREWEFIESGEDEWNKLHRFYRFWCLKESYVKALGTGIGFSLQRLEFHPNTLHLQIGNIATDTCVCVDGEKDTGWTFEETMLDDFHCIAVAIKHSEDKVISSPCQFVMLNDVDLLSSSAGLSENPDEDYWLKFCNKQDLPFGR